MRNNAFRAVLILMMTVSLLAVAGCSSAPSGSGPAPDTITAIGTGTGSAAPDTAQFSLGATFTSKARVTAQNGASKASEAIIAAVKTAGIDARDIQTGQISLSEQYGPSGTTIVGYQAFQSIDVKTKAIDKVSAAITGATTAGATNVSGPTFTLSDTNAARIDAITKAMADAKTRAEAIAKAAGRTLGRVISVTEAPASQIGPVFDSAAAGKSPVPVPVQPGQVESQIQLTVVFALQ
jgi:uncharacterized protein YggE